MALFIQNWLFFVEKATGSHIFSRFCRLGLQGFGFFKILYVSLNPAKWAGYPRISGQDIRFLRCQKHVLALGLKFHAYCG